MLLMMPLRLRRNFELYIVLHSRLLHASDHLAKSIFFATTTSPLRHYWSQTIVATSATVSLGPGRSRRFLPPPLPTLDLGCYRRFLPPPLYRPSTLVFVDASTSSIVDPNQLSLLLLPPFPTLTNGGHFRPWQNEYLLNECI